MTGTKCDHTDCRHWSQLDDFYAFLMAPQVWRETRSGGRSSVRRFGYGGSTPGRPFPRLTTTAAADRAYDLLTATRLPKWQQKLLGSDGLTKEQRSLLLGMLLDASVAPSAWTELDDEAA